MIFLGTGASQLIPNPFCDCRVCRYARQANDPREVRRRSALLLDDHTLIDAGPDVPAACNAYGKSLTELQSLFITHMHSDHWDLTTLENLLMCDTEPPHVRVYLSTPALEGLKAWWKARLEGGMSRVAASDYSKYQEVLSYTAVEPYEYGETEVGLRYSAVKTNHKSEFVGETALNYVLERNGRSMLYACDTGLYCEENYEFLTWKKLDILVLEGTFGPLDKPLDIGHMTYRSTEILLDRLSKAGAIDSHTKIYLSQIGHRMTHGECSQWLQERWGENAAAAYDGLEVPGV